MAYKPSPAQPPSALLRQVRPLRLLLNQAERLEHLQRLLESQLQPAAREHCHVASWRDGTLLLVVTDGHWATRLRYQQKRLLAALQAMEAFGNLRRILYKVQPPLVPAKRGGHAAELEQRRREPARHRRGHHRPQATCSTGTVGRPRQRQAIKRPPEGGLDYNTRESVRTYTAATGRMYEIGAVLASSKVTTSQASVSAISLRSSWLFSAWPDL